MLSMNRHLAISVTTMASLFTVQAAPAPPTDNANVNYSNDVANDQEKDIINDLAEEWASDNEDNSGEEGLPLDDQQDVNPLSADPTEYDEILDTTEHSQEVDIETFATDEGDFSTSELDPETQELEEIAKIIDNGVHIEVEQIQQDEGQEVNIEIEKTQDSEYMSQENFDDTTIETEAESNNAIVWSETSDVVPEIKQVDTEEIDEVTWDPEADEDPFAIVAAPDEDENTMENAELAEEYATAVENIPSVTVEEESFGEELPMENTDEEAKIDEILSKEEDVFTEAVQSEDDIKMDEVLTLEVDAEESGLENQEFELESDFGEDVPLEESETDEVYTTTEEEDGPQFFADKSTATDDELVVDTDIQDQIESLLDNLQQTMDQSNPTFDDIPDAIKPADSFLEEADSTEDSKTIFINAEGTDPFNPTYQPSIGRLGDESSGFSLNLLLLLAVIVFLVLKGSKIKRYLFSRESGSLPYHATGRKSRD